MNKTNDFDLIQKERNSIRKYDKATKIDHVTMEAILNEALHAPSSFNMQPCRFVIVESDQWKEKIKPHIQFNQLQNSTSAAMIFILGDYQCIEFGPKIYQSAVDQGHMSQDAMNRQMKFLTEYYSQASRQILKERILLDSGIFLMNLMLIARKYGYDTCPIGAFNKQDIVEILELDKERYFPVVILSIGRSDEKGHLSYRLPAKDLTFWR